MCKYEARVHGLQNLGLLPLTLCVALKMLDLIKSFLQVLLMVLLKTREPGDGKVLILIEKFVDFLLLII